MNRKVLAALLVVPVLFFATEKVIGLTNNTSTVKEKISNSSFSEEKSTDLKIFHSNLTNEELVNEMKSTILNRKGREKQFDASDYTGTWDEEKLGTNVRNLIRTKVVDKLTTLNICTINVQKSFSRCPSGYDAYVILKDGKVTNEGWMMASSGCDMEPIAMFRYDVNTSAVEGKISDVAGYVPLEEFCKIYKTAKKDLKAKS